MFTQSSWKSPWLRKLNRYSFRLLLSTMRSPGIYIMRISAKSGCPVIGQREVNSGTSDDCEHMNIVCDGTKSDCDMTEIYVVNMLDFKQILGLKI